MNYLARGLCKLARTLGIRLQPASDFADLEPEFLKLSELVGPFTMTSTERRYALYKSVEHIATRNIPGDFVECGVWKGGSAMLAALTLQRFEPGSNRRLFLYDTYTGMPEPGERDIGARGERARDLWDKSRNGQESEWCFAPLDAVRKNMGSTGYPGGQVMYVEGRVEQTLPGTCPDRVSLLRLDTDWYESTLHELTHLFPRLSPGGILLIDDYGCWKGAREATDKYFLDHRVPMFLARIDDTGRIGIKS